MAHAIVQDIIEEAIVRPHRRFRDIMNPFCGYTDYQVYQRYQFPPDVILELTAMLAGDIEHPTSRSWALPPLIQVCFTLRYLATNSFQIVGDTGGVAKSSIFRSIWRVLRSLFLQAEAQLTKHVDLLQLAYSSNSSPCTSLLISF